MQINEIFVLADGTTVLACSGCESTIDVLGKKAKIVSGDDIRQTLILSRERKMLNQSLFPDQKAFETIDFVNLSADEARSGNWFIAICE